MKLEWDRIISNAVTVLVATVFVGAAAQLWNGVSSIDQRIDENLVEIRATQSVLAPKVDMLEKAIQALLVHLDEVNGGKGVTPKGDFDFDPTPSIDQIEEERMHNQMMQQTPNAPFGGGRRQ
tara:strand:+ start:320 stop:685 length:366 start_codon:yes stop_codon:yes gene_type:complete